MSAYSDKFSAYLKIRCKTTIIHRHFHPLKTGPVPVSRCQKQKKVVSGICSPLSLPIRPCLFAFRASFSWVASIYTYNFCHCWTLFWDWWTFSIFRWKRRNTKLLRRRLRCFSLPCRYSAKHPPSTCEWPPTTPSEKAPHLIHQVRSLTQFHSVDFSPSRIVVQKCIFNKRTIMVCVSCSVLGPMRLAWHAWWVPWLSVVPDATHEASRGALKGRCSSKNPPRVWDWDSGVAGRNGRK